MACQGCVSCLTTTQGKFGPQVEEDGGIIVNGAGQMSVDFTQPSLMLDDRPADPAYPTCGNRVKIDAAGLTWADPAPGHRGFESEQQLFLNQNVTNTTVTNPFPYAINFDSEECYFTTWMFAVTRTVFLSTTGTDFEYNDYVDGVILPNSRLGIDVQENVDWEHTSSFFYTFTENPNANKNFLLGYSLQSTGTVVLYSIKWQIRALGIMAPRCV